MTFPQLAAALEAVGQLIRPSRGKRAVSEKTTRIKSLRQRPPNSKK